MGNLKLTVEDFYSSDFELVAIHTALEDFRLAYLLNKNLNIMLSKNRKEISIQTNEQIGYLPWFIYEDCKQDLFWNLVANKTTILTTSANKGFFDQENITLHLIPEMKKVDYFLKIENIDERFDTEKILKKITEIEQISTSFIVETQNIKSIKNLIF